MTMKKDAATMDFKAEAFRLVPFALSQAYFWSHDAAVRMGNPWVKCPPVICLMIYLLSHPTGLRRSSVVAGIGRQDVLPLLILIGLAFGCVGDALLTSDDTFLMGVLSFGLGHLFHALAIRGDMKRGWRLATGVNLAFTLALVFGVYLPCLGGGPLFYPVICYHVVSTVLLWRALARVPDAPEVHTRFYWCKVLLAAGVVSFGLSDSILITNMACFPVPHQDVLVMVLYYAGQLLITLGSCEVLFP